MAIDVRSILILFFRIDESLKDCELPEFNNEMNVISIMALHMKASLWQEVV
jgi:hypothetical protein